MGHQEQKTGEQPNGDERLKHKDPSDGPEGEKDKRQGGAQDQEREPLGSEQSTSDHGQADGPSVDQAVWDEKDFQGKGCQGAPCGPPYGSSEPSRRTGERKIYHIPHEKNPQKSSL